MAARGRKPGSLLNARCVLCGNLELSRGTSQHFRCTPCKHAGRRLPPRGRCVSDTERCGGVVALAIRDGLLLHPTSLRCVDCGVPAVEYDHRDYNYPLKVEPVCRSCNLKRGPAIPTPGALRSLLDRGYPPYRLRCRVEQLLALMGQPADVVRGLPKKLTVDHWHTLLPLFEAAEGSPMPSPAQHQQPRRPCACQEEGDGCGHEPVTHQRLSSPRRSSESPPSRRGLQALGP